MLVCELAGRRSPLRHGYVHAVHRFQINAGTVAQGMASPKPMIPPADTHLAAHPIQLPASLYPGNHIPSPVNPVPPASSVVQTDPSLVRCPRDASCRLQVNVTCRDSSAARALVASFIETSAAESPSPSLAFNVTTGPRGAHINLGPSIVPPVDCSVLWSISYTDATDGVRYNATGTLIPVALRVRAGGRIERGPGVRPSSIRARRLWAGAAVRYSVQAGCVGDGCQALRADCMHACRERASSSPNWLTRPAAAGLQTSTGCARDIHQCHKHNGPRQPVACGNL